MIPRTPPAVLRAVVDRMFARIPALRGADRRLCDLILPTEDLEAETRFVPGVGLLESPLGRLINAQLRLPEDGAPWPVILRADVYREEGDVEGSRGTRERYGVPTGAPPSSIDLVAWQAQNLVGDRADREQHVHLYSLMTMPDGTERLAISRRREAIQDPRELPDKARDRYHLTTTRIDDYRADPQFCRFLRRSEKLRDVVADADPSRLEIVRTDMDRPFQQPVLKEIGARSYNYYVLHQRSGARMHIHFFDFWHPEEGGGLAHRIGRAITPHEIGHYEVCDYRPAPRTELWDPTLGTGLKSVPTP